MISKMNPVTTACTSVKKEYIYFKTYVHETEVFLESIFNAILDFQGSSLKALSLWKDASSYLHNTSSYVQTLFLALSESEEPLQLDFLLNEFKQNGYLIRQQRQNFIFETAPLLLGMTETKVSNLEAMESEYWDMKEMYDEMVKRGLREDDEAKDLNSAWMVVEADWKTLKETCENIQNGILKNRYSITHLKLLIAYLTQSGTKLRAIKTSFGRKVSNILLKELETLTALECETGPIHLERVFYHHATNVYVSHKERLLLELERARTAEIISIQKLYFSMEVMSMTLMEIMLDSQKDYLHKRALRYKPGAFLGNHTVTTGQLISLLRHENNVMVACVMDCLDAQKKMADVLDQKGFDPAVNERYRQKMACVQEYSTSVLKDLALRADLLTSNFGLENITTLKTVWEEKLFKHEMIKKFDSIVRYLCNETERKADDNGVMMSTIARAVPQFSMDVDDSDGTRLRLSEEFMISILKEPLTLKLRSQYSVSSKVAVPMMQNVSVEASVSKVQTGSLQESAKRVLDTAKTTSSKVQLQESQKQIIGNYRSSPSKIPQLCRNKSVVTSPLASTSLPKSRPLPISTTGERRHSKIPEATWRKNQSVSKK